MWQRIHGDIRHFVLQLTLQSQVPASSTTKSKPSRVIGTVVVEVKPKLVVLATPLGRKKPAVCKTAESLCHIAGSIE
jgi:hypothetical protein